MTPYKTHKQAGFSLIDVSVLVVILGLLAASLLSSNQVRKEMSGFSRSQITLETADRAVREFYQRNKRLPCPAPLTVRAGNAAFAVEPTGAVACGGSTAPTIAANGMQEINRTGATVLHSTIRIGGLPTRTLGIPDSNGSDAWNRRILYVVLEDLATTPQQFSSFSAPAIGSEPLLIHRDRSSNNATSMTPGDGFAYVLISQGPDGQGAYTKEGVEYKPCDTVVATRTWDSENCNMDALFIDAPINQTAGTSYFYDLVRWVKYNELYD
ncbi:MAG: hypothetical protein K2Q12_09760 [Rickettsiales bacterium]|nr:hypothetical protein [Rickettsiales bacterium]